jgi:hypothetical protein
MYCDICRGRLPAPLVRAEALARKCACARSHSTTSRPQSVPLRLNTLEQSTTPRSLSARRLNIHERGSWYEGPRTREEVNAVNLEGGEQQPPVSSCDTGIYKKLDESKRQIRLLELHPGSEVEPISGNLITVDLPPLPAGFDENVFLEELVDTASLTIVPAVRTGKWVLKNVVDRWEFILNSLIWLFRYRLLESYHILRDAHGTPELKTLLRLKRMRLSRSTSHIQEIPQLLAEALLSRSAHHSWKHNLNGLIFRLCGQGTRSLHSMIHFAEQMDTAIDKFVSEDGNGMSALKSVDVPGLGRFLAEVDLGLLPIFGAVSWFWGDVKPGEMMTLNGGSLELPRNAIRALRDLRDNDLLKMLWIDAICINQDDKAERASQILLMSDIYSFAKLTYVWLGNEDPVIWNAMKWLHNILDLCRPATGSPQDVYHEVNQIVDISYLSKIFPQVSAEPGSPSVVFTPSANASRPPLWIEYAGSTKSIQELLDGLSEHPEFTRKELRSIIIPRACLDVWPLFENQWFKRLWVFQEVVLSESCEIVFSAKFILQWKALEDGAYFMQKFFDAPQGLHMTLGVVDARANIRTGIDRSSLQQLVAQTADRECSDPRDHIFGVLGLTSWARGRREWPHLIQPDYEKSVSDCMRDATRVMVQQTCGLSALLHWCPVGQSPTWAVHWHRHKHIDVQQRPSWPCIATTAAPSSLDLGLLDLSLMHENLDLNVLLVKGLTISIVHSTTPLLRPTVYVREILCSWNVLKEMLQHIMDLSTRTGFDFSPHTIALTLLACRACTPETEELCRLESLVNSLWDGLHSQRPEQCLDLLLGDFSIYSKFYNLCYNSKMFVTEAGQLCLGQTGVQEGDKIVQLFGLQFPALLRREQSWYTFAGVAYIDIEFPKTHGTSTLAPEIFEIR